MTLRVIIPVKPFGEAKQRLSAMMDPGERARLAEGMFRHVFRVSASCFGAANVLVVSRSEEVLALARREGGATVQEEKPFDLNSALSQARHTAAASRVLVLASDLPFLGADDLEEMAAEQCAIAPDRHRRGTNALLWPSQLSFAFGDNSFVRHRALAERAGLLPAIVEQRGLAQDVDVPEDLEGLEF